MKRFLVIVPIGKHAKKHIFTQTNLRFTKVNYNFDSQKASMDTSQSWKTCNYTQYHVHFALKADKMTVFVSDPSSIY